MSSNRKERIPFLVLKEEIQGEKFFYWLRWCIVIFELVLISVLAVTGRFLSTHYYAYGFIAGTAIYNFYLGIVFRQNRYRCIIKYFSVLIDTVIVTCSIYAGSYLSSSIGPVTNATVFLYIVILAGSALRQRKMFTVYTVGLVLTAFNLVYFLRYPEFSLLPFFSEITSGNIIGQVFKSLYILFLGYILYHITGTSRKLMESVVHSISRSREREAHIRHTYETIMNGINDGIVASNTQREIVFNNPAFEKLTLFEPNELRGMDIRLLLSEEEPGSFREERRTRVSQDNAGNVTAFETGIRRKDGITIPIEVSVSTTVLDGERVYLATIRDIRKRKELERSLIQSYKMETMGKLACGFAHDLNNLLTVIRENHYLARNETDLEAMRGHLNGNEEVVGKAKELIDQILVFARGDGSVEKTTPLPVILMKIETLAQKALGESVPFHFRNEVKNGSAFKANETGILQVLLNLIMNAREAVGRDGRIEVSARTGPYRTPERPVVMPKERNADFLMISVKDNGTGIDEAILDKIFEPCFTTKLEGEVLGNGLGLAIVYSVVEKLGGGLCLESVPGEGSDFTVSIPLLEEAGEGDTSPRGKTGKEHRGASILLVDDDEDLRLIGKQILEKNGYRVGTAGSGEKAVDLLDKGNRYDLCILDYHMPGLDGSMLIEELSGKTDMPIIILTGETSDTLESLHGLSAVRDVVSKPLDVESFLGRVGDVLGSGDGLK